MRRLLSAFRRPVDQVVAVRDTESAVESAVQTLGNAGYHATMLTVVGRRCPQGQSCDLAASGRASAWRRSGLFWGTSLAALMSAASLALPGAALAPPSLMLVACLVLALQARTVAAAVAPEPSAGASWRSSAPGCLGHEHELAADKLLLLVEGSRSEIALARTLLTTG